MENTIPKKIFYVWGKDEPLKNEVSKCILSWKEKLPDYEIIEINEASVEYFNFQEELKNNVWFRTIYKRKMYAYVSDYIRIKVLYENGGIYLDTDVTVLKNFDEFLNEPCFVGFQSDGQENLQLLEPAVLGAKKGNPLLKDIMEFYKEDIWKLPIYSMPQIFKYFIDKKYQTELEGVEKSKQQIVRYPDVTIYPEKYFIPYRYDDYFNFDCIENETHTIHWFNASWHKKDVVFFLENKHKVRLKCINQIYVLKLIFDRILMFFENIFSIKYAPRAHKKVSRVIRILGIKYSCDYTDKIKKSRNNKKVQNSDNNSFCNK